METPASSFRLRANAPGGRKAISYHLKTLLCTLFCGLGAVSADDPLIDLTPNAEQSYALEITQKFADLLESDDVLRKQFEQYQKEAKETAGGRWDGPKATPFVLHESWNVLANKNGDRFDYGQTLVIYYAFPVGYHRGMTSDTGVFAVFRITGVRMEAPNGDVIHESARAAFQGFRKTLVADSEPDQ